MNDTMTSLSFKIENKAFWSEFLDLYKNSPELWDTRLDIYKDRLLKSAGYDKLVMKLKELNPAADRNEARRKINAFRTNYRRELKKKLNNEMSYTSSLWYFDKLEFLATLDQEKGPSCIDSSAEDEHTLMTINTSEVLLSKRRKRIVIDNPENKLSKEEKEAKRIRDNEESEILAKSWALQYSKLSNTQKIFARKAISDILFEGCLGTLNRNSIQTITEQSCMPYEVLQKNDESIVSYSSNEFEQQF